MFMNFCPCEHTCKYTMFYCMLHLQQFPSVVTQICMWQYHCQTHSWRSSSATSLSSGVIASFTSSADLNLHPYNRAFFLRNSWQDQIREYRGYEHTVMSLSDTPMSEDTEKLMHCHGGAASFQTATSQSVYSKHLLTDSEECLCTQSY